MSSVWVDGEMTGDTVNGVSAIDVNQARYLDNVSYSGGVVLILGGDRAEGGYDPSEIVMDNPKILDIKYVEKTP